MAIFSSTAKQRVKSKVQGLTQKFAWPSKKRLVSAMKKAHSESLGNGKSELFKHNAFTLEQLEPRLLLSADPLAAAFAASADVTLQVVEKAGAQQYIQLIDNSVGANSAVLGEMKISDIVAGDTVTITGSAANDKLTVDKSFLDLGEQTFVVQFDGAGGTDNVSVGSDVEQSSWQISGDYEGSLGNNGSVEFISVEEIEATHSNDSSHVLSAINDSYQWLIDNDNQGVIASLETQQFNELQGASNSGIKFSGFDSLAGSGTDQLNYSLYSNSGVNVDLETGAATGFTQVAGIKVIVGSNQDDILAGDTNDNDFVVDFGDTVTGAGGYDSLVYREQGATGVDVELDKITSESDFVLRSGDWDGAAFTDDGGVITANDVDFLSAFGGSGENYFDFTASDLQLHLDGGDGDDHLIGGDLDDLLTGGSGADIIDGGAHVSGDELVELRTDDFLVSGDTLTVGSDGADTLLNIESLYLRAFTQSGDTQGKTLDARLANNYQITLTGSELNDTIYASGFGDTLVGLGGADTITAGIGVDTFSEDFVGRAMLSYTGVNATSGFDYSVDLAQGDNEKWQLTRPATTSGTGFVLSITTVANGVIATEEILWTSTASEVATAIEKALGLDFGHLSVQLTGDVWDVEFVGLYGAQQIATALQVNNSAAVSIAQAATSENDTLLGFSASDNIALRGSFSADYVDISGFKGIATIETYAGEDTVFAGSGLNTIAAGDGNDTIYLQGKSADEVDAGSGSDELVVDLSADTTNSHSIDLDNQQLLVNANTVILSGVESVSMHGSVLADSFNASDFHGVSSSTALSQLEGWSELSEHTLRLTLDDGSSTIIDLDVSALDDIQALLDLLNSVDDRVSDALSASFDQATASVQITGLSHLTVAGTSTDILAVLGLSTNAVSVNVLNGVSLSLLAALQLTNQKGNGGDDSFIGSKGNDNFDLGLALGSTGTVDGGLGVNTLSVSTAASHTTIELSDTQVLWKGATAAADVSANFSAIDTLTVNATTGAVLLDASSVTASLDVVLDAGTTNAELKSGLGSNQLKVDITGRTSAINATVLDTATNNEVVFYGGGTQLSSSDFGWVSVSGSNSADYTRSVSSDLSIDENIIFADKSISIKSSGTITINADVITDSASSIAGDISFQAKDIVVSDNVTISAQGLTLALSGDITLLAIDDSDEVTGLGFYNSDVNSASIVVNAAHIQGKDIVIYAVAESDPLTPISERGGVLNAAQEFGSNVVDILDRQSLIAGYANANVTATVNIAQGAVIEGDNVSIKAKAIARVTANPTSIAIVVAIGNLKSTADLQVHGTIIAQGNVELISQTSNYLNVRARPLFGFDTAIKGYAASVAVGILDSTNNAKVSDTANIIAKGDFTLQARTFDYAYVLAESDAGTSGKMATGVAIHLEKGDTTATLLGDALIQGDVTVQAVQVQGDVEGNSGTDASGLVNRVPSVIGKYWDKVKQGIADNGTSIPLVGKMMKPSDRLKPTKFTAGIAFAYTTDINNVSAYIGEVGKTSDIQVGGALDLFASADARLLSSASSESITPSQMSQVPGASGAFTQVPFGGAVSVIINTLDNNALAQVQGNTQLDVLGTLTIDSLAQNLTGLIDKDTTIKYVKPDLISSSQISQPYAIEKDALIRFDTSDYDWQQLIASEEPELSSYWLGGVYKYLGNNENVYLNSEDFSDLTRWERLGDMVTSLPSQLFGGASDLYLIDNKTSSVAAGAKFSIALNAIVLDSKQTAHSKVLTGALINQRDDLSNSFTASTTALNDAANDLLTYTPIVADRDLTLNALTINKSIDYTGTRTSTKSFLVPQKVNELKGASESREGVGAGVVINTVKTDSQAIIESGAKVRANTISLNANSEVFGATFGYASGSGIGNLGVAGLYMGNTITSTTIAQVESGVDLVAAALGNGAADVGLNVVANNRVDFIILAGGSGDGASVGVGASAAVTKVTKVTKALIGSAEKSGTVDVAGDVLVDAKSEGLLISAAVSSAWATGKKAPAGGSTPPAVNTNYGVSAAGAFIYNDADYTTSANVSNLLSFSAANMSVNAYEGGGVYAFPIAYASSEANKFALAAAGVVLINDVDITLSAGVSQITTLSLSQLSINANNNSTIVTTSLSLGMASIAQTSVGSSSSIALTGNVAINNVNNNIDAYLNDIGTMTVSGANASGIGASIEAKDESEIYAVAAGVAYAGNGAVGVTYAENNIISNTDALIDSIDLTMHSGSVKLTADSEADILSVALGASVVFGTTTGTNTQVGLSVAAAISANVVRANTRAKTNNSTITLPDQAASFDTLAKNNSDIAAVVVAASVGLQSGGTNSISLSGAGASVSNAVYGDTEAFLTASSIDQQLKTSAANTNVSVKAEVTGNLNANVVGASIALASATSGTGVAGAIGVSIATNNVGKDPDNSNAANNIAALISGTDISISGSVSNIAKSTQTITANVVAVSVGLAQSTSGVAGALTGVGADTTNNVKVDVSAIISASSTPKSLLASSFNIYAEDTSKVRSFVVGAAVSGSFSGSSTSASLAIGVSLAENNIDNDLTASANNVLFGSLSVPTGNVTIKSKANATITATSVAASVAVALGSSGVSVSLSGGGADAHNAVSGVTSATLIDTVIYSTGTVNLEADNTSTIEATVVAVAASASSGSTAVGISIGAAISHNDIGTSSNRFVIESYLQNSKIVTSGVLSVLANNDMTITAGVGAGAMAVALSSGTGVSGAGSGVNTTNNVYSKTAAYLKNNTDSSKTINASSVSINALSTVTIDATAGSASLAFAASQTAISIAVAASLAYNTIDSQVEAKVFGVQGGGSQILTDSMAVLAQDTATITSKVVGVSLAAGFGTTGIAVSVGAVEAENNVSNDINALVSGIEIHTLNGGLSVNALENATVTLEAEAAAVSIAAGKVGVAVSGAGAKGTNTIGNKTISGIADSIITTDQRYDHLSSDTSKVLASNDLVEFSDGVYRYSGSEINYEADFAADGYAYDDLGNVVGAQRSQVLSNEKLRYFDGNTYKYTGATTLSLDAANALLAAGDLSSWVQMPVSVDFAAHKLSNSADWTLVYATADYVTQDISVLARNTTSITAKVGAASASAGGGAIGGAGAIGVTLLENNVGDGTATDSHQSQASITNSSINALNDVKVEAYSDSTINSTVYGASVAVSGGKFSFSGAGVGINLENNIEGSTLAYIDSSDVLAGQDIEITADATGLISKADGTAVAVSVAVSIGGAVSISATTLENTIAMDVDSYLNLDNSRTLGVSTFQVSAGNNLDVSSNADARFNNIKATAVTVSAGLVGASGGGVDIHNQVDNKVNAKITGSGEALVGAKATVSADETTELNIAVTNVAVSASIGASIGVALVRNEVKSRVNARINNATIIAANIDLLASVNNQIKETKAVGFSASLLAAAANRADVDITTVVEATTDAANLSATDTIKIEASSTNYARAQSSGGSAGAIAIGAMIADIEQGVDGTNEVVVQIGDSSVINAGTLQMTASGDDDILAKSVAGAGGLVAAVGSQSNATSYQAAVANVGKGVTINVTNLDVNAKLDQEIDASADAFSIGLLAGTGAGLRLDVKSSAIVNLGASTNSSNPGASATIINAHDMKVNALNNFDKSVYANGKNLRSGSASIASVSALYSTTTIDNKAIVNLTEGVELIAVGSYDDKASIAIEAINDIKAVDNITLETLSLAGGINVAISEITADSESKVYLNDAVIDNVTGEVYLTAKTDSENRASADILAISGLQSASGGGADVNTNATNNIDVNNADIKAGDIYMYAGKSRTGVLNILESSSNVEITSVSTSVSITVPNPQAYIDEVNNINLGANTNIKAMRDVTIEAREGIGANDRAQESGLTLSISGVPYGFEVDRDGDTSSSNNFTVDATANIIAGVNNKTFLQVRPVEEVQGILDSHVNAAGVIDVDALSTVQKELLFGVPDDAGVVQVPELPEDIVYVMQALDVASISFNVSQDTVIKHGNSYYRYLPVDSAELDLQSENYNNLSRWQNLTSVWNGAFESLYTVYESTITSSLSSAMTDQFYVVKPQELETPTLTYTNLSTILFEQKAQVESWMISHSTNAEAIARYQVQLGQINSKIADLGLADLVHKVEIGQVVKAQDGNFYASKIKQKAILELADYQDTQLWTAVGSTASYWDYDDTANADPDSTVYNRELDMLMVDLPDVYASPGSVYIQIDGKSADSLVAQSNMDNISARAGATIQVINSTPFSLRVNDLIVQDAQRVENINGVLKTYTPGAVQFNYKDVNSVAVRAGVTLTNGSDLSSAQVVEVNQIVLFQDTKSTRVSYGSFTLPPIPQNMYIQGNIVNENGSAYINNKDGSIEVSTQIRAETINLFAAGDFSLNSEAWYHTNKDPRQYISYSNLRSLVYASSAGELSYDLDQIGIESAINSDNSQILSMGKITITARHLNVNGLIQSGVNTVYLKVDASFNGGANNVELANIKGQAIAGISFANPNAAGNVKVPVNGYWDASAQAIVIEDIVPTGGEVILSGQIISTGNGRIVAASGYAAVDIVNDSLYELIINDIDTRKYREGIVTIIDSATLTKDVYAHAGAQATHTRYQGTLIVGDAASGEISRIDYVQQGSVTSQDSSLDYQYVITDGTRYVWTEGQGKTSTEIRKYEKKSFNLFGDNALADWLVADDSYKWKTVEFTDQKPLLESESIIADSSGAAEYKITYLQTAGDTSVNDIDTDTWTTGGGWLRKKTVHTKVTIIEGLKDYYTHSLKADHAINVSFLSGNEDANVSIASAGNITLAGRISMPDQGTLQVSSTYGSVTMSDGVYALTREAHIRAAGNIDVILEGNFQDRGHTLISSNGSINLGVVQDDNPGIGQVSSNQVYLDQVYAKYDVNINAGGGIYSATSSVTTTISANNINLSALGGSVGALTINSAITNASGTVSVVALGNINMSEVVGDMNVASIVGAQEVNNSIANYGVQLSTLNGSILDANSDTAKATALDTQNAQYNYAQSQVVNDATDVTADYHQYWQGLRTDADGAVVDYQSDVTQYTNYDSLFSHLSGAELSAAQDSVALLNASFTTLSEYDKGYDKLAQLQVEDPSLDTATNSQFKRDVIAQQAINKPLFDSILSPGIVAKLYPDTVIIGGAGASTAEVANIQSLASGSKITLTANSGGFGKIGDNVVIDMSGGVSALSDKHKEILSAATGSDVIDTQYSFYQYIGPDAAVSQFDIDYTDSSLWQGISSIKVTDTTGTVNVANNAYVEINQDGVPVLFQYQGADAPIDLSAEDYEASGAPWQRVSTQSVAPAQDLALNNNAIVMQLESVTLQLWDDLNLEGAASLTLTADEGIAIEQSGDLVLDKVVGDSWIRLTAAGHVIDNSANNSANNSAIASAGDVVIIARGDIKAADGSAFKLQLADTATLSLDATGSVNVWQVEESVVIAGNNYQIGDLNLADIAAVGNVTIGAGTLASMATGLAPSGTAAINVEKIASTGSVTLLAASGIYDAFDDLSNAIINVRSVDLHLYSGGGIGAASATNPNYLDIKISGAVSASAIGNVYLNAVESHLLVANIESTIDVYLKASQSILDSENDNAFQDISLVGNSDIKADSIYLNALKGAIGQFGNQLEIDTDAANGGQLTSYSFLDTYLRETTGDLNLANMTADSDNQGAADSDIYLVVDQSLYNTASSGVNLNADKVRIITGADIGAAVGVGTPIISQINYLEARSDTGAINWENTGHLQLGSVSDLLAGVSAAGNINIVANSPLTVLEHILSNTGDISLSAADSAASATDILNVASTAQVTALQGNVTLNAGDELMLSQGAKLSANASIILNTDLGSADSEAATVSLYGQLQASDIHINTGIANDSVLLDVEQLDGDTYVKTGAGDDLITVNQLHSRADILQLNGEAGSDSYVINRTAANAGYAIDVIDTGAQDSGADTLTINGTSDSDEFLLRAGFVAALHLDNNGEYTSNVERINYDKNINARLTINGHDGADNFYSDDNSSITTLDGGAGNDSFQIGQLFADDRQSSLGNVAIGDEIETTETTLGFLSKGNSFAMVIYGGDGEDQVKVYSNKATTKLYGEDGDDSFVVRAFLQKGSQLTAGGGDVELFGGDGDDSIQYSINSPLSIDGGKGTDTVVVLGTEADDSFMITEDGIFGAGLNVGFTGVELAEVDGLEGDDTFYVLSTSADVVTTIIGGLGADTFNVAGDVTTPIVSYSVEGRSSFINHSVLSDDAAYNGIFVNGLALNVADSSNGAVKVDALDGQLLVDEDGLVDSYQISMDVAQPTLATLAYITVSAARASSSDKSLAHNGIAADSVLVSTDNINFYESLVISVDSTSNWADKHEIYVRAVNDTSGEGQRDYVISHSVSSENPDFDALDIANIEVTVNDNDQADLIVTSSVNPIAIEAGASSSFDVRLATAPAIGETVTVSLAEIIPAGLVAQVSLDKLSLEFNSSNWDQLQSFVVSAVDDADVENLYQANISLTTSSNITSDYAILADVKVDLSVIDNDTGAVVVSASNGSTVVSASNSDDYSLSLSKKPTAPVTINLLNDQQVLITSTDPRFNSVDNTVTFGIADGDWDSPITLIVSPDPSYQPDLAKQPVQKPGLQAHTLDNIRGKLIIDGGVPADKQRTLSAAVMLPTELDGELVISSLGTDESVQTDQLYLFNDGSVQNDSGILTASSITGLGMGVGLGIEYTNIEVLQTYLGTGNDDFEVSGTAQGSISVIHGGGGNDTLSVTGSDSDSALILLGDSVQDGSSYNATSLQETAFAREFNNPGDDTIDASGAGGSVVIYGGQGDDDLTGSNYGDHIVGGSGEDTIQGLDGVDHIYGDSGVNLDLSVRLDLSSQVLHIVNTADAANDNPETADTLTVSRDIIDGGAGDDIILADKGIITQLLDTNRILTTAAVINITNSNRNTGGDDSVLGGSGNDIIIGGLGQDTIAGGADNDLIIGDHATVELDNNQIIRAYSIDTASGNSDDLRGNEGNDILIGGFAADSIIAGAGDDTVLGDNGQIELIDGIRRHVYSTDLSESTGGNDTISLGTGEDQAIAGVGADRITNTAGETLIIGDDGQIFSDATGRYLRAFTGNTSIGGADIVTGGSDRDIIFGGFGGDRLDGAQGDDIIGGDGSQITRNPDNIVFEAIDLFFGGDDTLLAGAGLDRLMGAFGSDLFYADFREDIFVGEYARFTFSADATGNEQATFIISLAQGGLDLIRQTQTSLFVNFAQQIFEQSELGAIARGRTAITTSFSSDALAALGRLSQPVAQHGEQGAVQIQSDGVDFVIPTAPTAAGGEEGEEPVAEEDLQYDEDGFVIQAESVEEAEATAETEEDAAGEEEGTSGEKPENTQAELEAQAEDFETQSLEQPVEDLEDPLCIEVDGDNICETPVETSGSETQPATPELEEELQKLQNSAAANDTSGIDLKATLASFSGWALMGASKAQKAKRKAS